MRTLRNQRENMKIPQSRMAEALGVIEAEYAWLEEHPDEMSVPQALLVCDLLGCDIDFLMASGVSKTNELDADGKDVL